MTCKEVRECLNEIRGKFKDDKRYNEALEIAESYVNFAELGFKLVLSNGEKKKGE